MFIRLEKTTLKECKKATCIMTIKIAPAPIGEMFMNIDEEVHCKDIKKNLDLLNDIRIVNTSCG